MAPVSQPLYQQDHSLQQQEQSLTLSTGALIYPYEPAMRSSFGSSYHASVQYNEDEYDPSATLSAAVIVTNPDTSIPHAVYVQHYIKDVLPRQYMLADTSISATMYELLRRSPSATLAACVLSALHMQHSQQQRVTQAVLPWLFQKLNARLPGPQDGGPPSEDHAMACLHMVSSYLFEGGRGDWNKYLSIALTYVRNMFANPSLQYIDPRDVLKRCSETTRFIIKTTIWFDVLASVTTQGVPCFMQTYRDLFDDARAHIDDDPNPELSMLPVMGCENKVVLAIAEISELADWKAMKERRGELSLVELVKRGKQILKKRLMDESPSSAPASLPTEYQHMETFGIGMRGLGLGGLPYANGIYPPRRQQPQQHTVGTAESEAEVNQRRKLTNDIFRASAKIYLHTVISGDFPACPDIVESVRETIDCLRRVPRDRFSVHRGVVRSVVFGICLSGCLTDNPNHKTFLTELLESQSGESVGNIAEVKKLMQEVWERRQNRQGPVNWREVMKEGSKGLLLLV